jgi:hypothetical protein
MSLSHAKKVAAVIRDSGGTVIGRTRLQKITYLLTATGFETGFNFNYKHYGPFCDDVAIGARFGNLLGDLCESEQHSSWGGLYSIYETDSSIPEGVDPARLKIAQLAANADAVALELAATAVFLANDGFADPWAETERRKPEKCEGGKLAAAKTLLAELQSIKVPVALPQIN